MYLLCFLGERTFPVYYFNNYFNNLDKIVCTALLSAVTKDMMSPTEV